MVRIYIFNKIFRGITSGNTTQLIKKFSAKLLDLSLVSWTEPHCGVIFKVIVM